MRWLLTLAAALWAFQAPASLAAEAWLSMVYTNALHKELPYSIFSKGKWAPDPKARFVKLHLYFDAPVKVSALEIDDCGSGLVSPISVFINFDEWQFADIAAAGAQPPVISPRKGGNLLVAKNPDPGEDIRSLTINFEKNTGIALCGIKLKDRDGRAYDLKVPALVGGTVAASSVLAPKSAYAPIFLFDSRFEYGWASNKKAKNVDLRFTFDRPRRVEKIRIWNGYQRSVRHCLANSRVRKIRITGDGGYVAEIRVKDVLGSQVIALPKPFEGKNLKFHIAESYAGKQYKDLVVSELRFFDGKKWFLLDPAQPLKRAIATNKTAFGKARVGALLNDSYTGSAEIGMTFASARLRLRADGSFYVSGVTAEEADRYQYFALGNYEVKMSRRGGGLRLRLFGLYYESEIYGDCNGCSRDCNKAGADGAARQKIFQEYVTITPGKDGQFELANESGGKKLKFKKLSLNREKGR